MKKFEVLMPVSLRNGTFKLTPEQFRRREAVVNVLNAKERIVEPKAGGEISFKRGEIIEADVDVPKGNTSLAVIGSGKNEEKEPAGVPQSGASASSGGDESQSAAPATSAATESIPAGGEGAPAEDAASDPLDHVPESPPAGDPPSPGASSRGRKRGGNK